MLEDINKIDWGGYGNANIPRWLEGLTSTDMEIRKRALYRIDVGVVKEEEISDGNLRPASALSSDIPELIVPFLIELLTSQTVYTRSVILNFLEILASYHLRFKDSEGKLGLNSQHLARAQRIYDLVLGGVRIYHKLLRDDDPDVRESARYLLESLGKY